MKVDIKGELRTTMESFADETSARNSGRLTAKKVVRDWYESIVCATKPRKDKGTKRVSELRTRN